MHRRHVIFICCLLSFSCTMRNVPQAVYKSGKPEGKVAFLGEMLGYVNQVHQHGTFQSRQFDIAHIRVDSIVYGRVPPYLYVVIPDGLVFVEKDGRPVTHTHSFHPWGFIERGDRLLVALAWSDYYELFLLRYYRFLTPNDKTAYGTPVKKLVRIEYRSSAWDTLSPGFHTVNELRSFYDRTFIAAEPSLKEAIRKAVEMCTRKRPND